MKSVEQEPFRSLKWLWGGGVSSPGNENDGGAACVRPESTSNQQLPIPSLPHMEPTQRKSSVIPSQESPQIHAVRAGEVSLASTHLCLAFCSTRDLCDPCACPAPCGVPLWFNQRPTRATAAYSHVQRPKGQARSAQQFPSLICANLSSVLCTKALATV